MQSARIYAKSRAHAVPRHKGFCGQVSSEKPSVWGLVLFNFLQVSNISCFGILIFINYALTFNIQVGRFNSSGLESLNVFVQWFRSQLAYMRQDTSMTFLPVCLADWNIKKIKGTSTNILRADRKVFNILPGIAPKSSPPVTTSLDSIPDSPLQPGQIMSVVPNHSPVSTCVLRHLSMSPPQPGQPARSPPSSIVRSPYFRAVSKPSPSRDPPPSTFPARVLSYKAPGNSPAL